LVVLPPLAGRRDAGACARRAARPGPAGGRARPAAERREPRQPVGQDGGKRGARGYDAGKKVKGRKRHLVVDTLGLIHGLKVHTADIQDRDGARLLLAALIGKLPRLRRLWADGGYAGQLVAWVRERAGWDLEIVKRSDDMRGFVVLPKRWIVERTFAWLGKCRRLSKDYEHRIESSEAMVRLAMIGLMARRLRPAS
jgi:putative transposase